MTTEPDAPDSDSVQIPALPKWEPALRWDCAPPMYWRACRLGERARLRPERPERVRQAWRPATVRRASDCP